MARTDRVRLVVLFGGRSAEHDVSCVSAYHVLRAVDPGRYAVDAIGITREGQWVRADGAQAVQGAGARALPHAPVAPHLEAIGTAVEPLHSVLRAPGDGLPVVVLPILHGPHGEDGTVQGMLELAGVPYVGSGVLGSALAMDKLKAKDVLAANGIPQAPWVGLRDVDVDRAAQAVTGAGLRYPLFVKPANMGSSVGVSKVGDEAALGEACAAATRYDEWVVVEQAVPGRELEIGVLGNARPRASIPGEVRPGAEFYDYDDKYLDGAAELLIPAPVPREVVLDMQQIALRAFTALRCDGMARVDFFWDEGGQGLVVNEVNTIPGFTPISMYPKLWAASGVPYPELIDELVRLALERHEHRSRFSTKQ